MEYIQGRSLDRIAPGIFKSVTWIDLPTQSRLLLLQYAETVIDIVERMHEKGYIHRDITPGNFLVDKRNRIWMIDLELSYNEIVKRPAPPFRLGTFGYMSPEQLLTKVPKVEQDVYAIGALLIVLLTGLSPDKFSMENIKILSEQLIFFIPDQPLTDLICSCLDENPTLRPAMKSIKEGVKAFREKQPGSVALK